jgi:type I restriction enzyme R subunit
MDYTTQPIAELTNGIIIEEYVKVDRYNSDIYQTESEMEKKLISDLVSGQQYTFFDGKTDQIKLLSSPLEILIPSAVFPRYVLEKDISLISLLK